MMRNNVGSRFRLVEIRDILVARMLLIQAIICDRYVQLDKLIPVCNIFKILFIQDAAIIISNQTNHKFFW